MYSTPQKFGIKITERKVLIGFWTMTEITPPITVPVPPPGYPWLESHLF